MTPAVTLATLALTDVRWFPFKLLLEFEFILWGGGVRIYVQIAGVTAIKYIPLEEGSELRRRHVAGKRLATSARPPVQDLSSLSKKFMLDSRPRDLQWWWTGSRPLSQRWGGLCRLELTQPLAGSA